MLTPTQDKYLRFSSSLHPEDTSALRDMSTPMLIERMRGRERRKEEERMKEEKGEVAVAVVVTI